MTRDSRIEAGGTIRLQRLCLIGVMSTPDRPGLAAAIFSALGQGRISAQFIVQSIDLNNDSHIQFCVADDETDRAVALIQPIADSLRAQRVTVRRSVGLVSVYGPDFRERPGIAAAAFDALAAAGINILAVSTSISTISCVIDDSEGVHALEALRKVFVLP